MNFLGRLLPRKKSEKKPKEGKRFSFSFRGLISGKRAKASEPDVSDKEKTVPAQDKEVPAQDKEVPALTFEQKAAAAAAQAKKFGLMRRDTAKPDIGSLSEELREAVEKFFGFESQENSDADTASVISDGTESTVSMSSERTEERVDWTSTLETYPLFAAHIKKKRDHFILPDKEKARTLCAENDSSKIKDIYQDINNDTPKVIITKDSNPELFGALDKKWKADRVQVLDKMSFDLEKLSVDGQKNLSESTILPKLQELLGTAKGKAFFKNFLEGPIVKDKLEVKDEDTKMVKTEKKVAKRMISGALSFGWYNTLLNTASKDVKEEKVIASMIQMMRLKDMVAPETKTEKMSGDQKEELLSAVLKTFDIKKPPEGEEKVKMIKSLCDGLSIFLETSKTA